MKRILTVLLAALMVASVFAGCGGGDDTKTDAPGVFSVGYAKVDITPSLELTLPLVGSNDEKTRVATGILEPLYATCTAMTDAEGNTVILFALDTHGISLEFLTGVRNGIQKELGVEGKYVQMTASHTHQAPPLTVSGYGYADGFIHMNNIIDKCIEAAKAAMEDRKPATMSIGHTRVDGVNFIRYYYLEDGTLLGTHRTNDSQAPYYGQAYHPDNLLQLVRFEREGAKDVLLINWQAHYRGNPDGQYTMYSSDYMAVMRNQLLDQAGCESVFILGASGNLTSHSSYPSLNTALNADYKAVGENLAKQALITLNEGMTPAETGKITLEENIYHIQTNKNDYNLYTFGIGDVGFCMMPYEPFQSLGMAVRDESPYAMTFIGTCANGNSSTTYSNFYLPDAAAYASEGATPEARGYGVSQRYVKGDEALFHEQYMEMLNKCFDAGTTEKKEKAEGYVTDYTPYADPTEYLNPNPGTEPELVKNGLYRLQVVKGGTVKVLLIDSEEVAKEMSQKASFKVLMDNRDIVVGLQ